MERLRIAKLSIEGVKAYDRVVELSALNLLTGDVGSGKSSILDAIRFACLGLIPHLGKREADTARIMRGSRLVVRVELSDGRWFTRSLGREQGALRAEARSSWLPSNATNTAHAGAIRGLFGDSDEEAAEHLDLRELLAATPSQRAARIEALLSATAMRPEDATAWTLALSVARLAKLDETRIPELGGDRDAMVLGLLPTLGKPIESALGAALKLVAGELKGRGIPGALEFANGQKREATQAVTRKTAARAEIEDRADEASVPADSLEALDKRRQGATDRVATVRAQLAAYGTAKEARDLAELAVVNARGKTADHEATRASLSEARADADRWRDKAANLQDPPEVRSPKLVETDRVRLKAAEDLEREAGLLDAEASDLDAKPQPKPVKLFTVPSTDAKVESLAIRRGALERAKADPWTRVAEIVDAIDELHDLNMPDPLLALVNELEGLAKRHGRDVPQIQADVDAAVAALAEAEKEAAAAVQANTERQAEHDLLVKAREADTAKAAELRAQAAGKRERSRGIRDTELARVAEANAGDRAKHAELVKARTTAVDAIKATRDRLTRQADAATSDADADEKAIVAEEADLTAALAKLEGIAVAQPIDVPGAEAEVADLGRTIDQIDEAKRLVAGADARKRELEAIAAEIATAQASSAAWTALEWALQRLRERDLAGRGGPLIDRMRVFLRAAGHTEEPYLRATKTATDFGWRRAGQELAVEALSGGETVLFTTALAAAVIALRRPALPLLLVEAAELGEADPIKATVAGLAAISEGFGNVLAATCFRLKHRDGWTMFRLSGSAPMEVIKQDDV